MSTVLASWHCSVEDRYISHQQSYNTEVRDQLSLKSEIWTQYMAPEPRSFLSWRDHSYFQFNATTKTQCKGKKMAQICTTFLSSHPVPWARRHSFLPVSNPPLASGLALCLPLTNKIPAYTKQAEAYKTLKILDFFFPCHYFTSFTLKTCWV